MAGAFADAPELSAATSGFESLTDASSAVAASNVVALSPGRLADRITEIGSDKAGTLPAAAAAFLSGPRQHDLAAANADVIAALRQAVAEPLNGAHILVLGEPGSGRRASALRIASERASGMPAPDEWIYTTGADHASALQPFAVPAGEGARLTHDANAAVAMSAAMLERLVASDDHKINLDILEEEHRHRQDRVFETLKRRAEGQNIALVKTLEGFVLAPMHEGRVVRSEVFRALPESLQRDVEAKMTALESELQALVVAMPEVEMEAHYKTTALSRQVALRAVKPNVSALRGAYAGMDAATALLDLLENQFVTRASDGVHWIAGEPFHPGRTFHAAGAAPSEAAATAPVVFARHVAPADLCGEIGRDAAGTVALRSGHLMHANGGYLLIEAWRLATEARNWAALSAALETSSVTPEPAPGVAVTAAPVPLSIKVILIADHASWAKLEAIDPGISQHFPTVVNFESHRAPA